MPYAITLEGRGELGRMEDWLRIAIAAYITEEFSDFKSALDLVVGIGQALQAQYVLVEHKPK